MAAPEGLTSGVELTKDDQKVITEEIQKQSDDLKNKANELFAGIRHLVN
jgi:hypothetical protein